MIDEGLMYHRGLREDKTILPILKTGNTRAILDRGNPPPRTTGEQPWKEARWDIYPDEVFGDIPGYVPGWDGQDWPAGDAGLIPVPPERLDPCHWGGPPNQV